MRLLGVVLILAGLLLAVIGFHPAPQIADLVSAAAAVPERLMAATSSASTPISAVVTLDTSTARAEPAPLPELASAEQSTLVRELQRELARVGCYDGPINGVWNGATRQAMRALIERVNARLPTEAAQVVHLALVKGQNAYVCGDCPPGEQMTSSGQCTRQMSAATSAVAVAPHASLPDPARQTTREERSATAQRTRRARPTEGRMSVGAPVRTTAAASEPETARAAPTPGQQRRAERHRKQLAVAHGRSRYLRPMRVPRYASRRPRGFLALLLGF